MAITYTDRWGVPVQAADGELALARIYRAYLSLYATTAEAWRRPAPSSSRSKPAVPGRRPGRSPRARPVTWPPPGPGPTVTGRRPPGRLSRLWSPTRATCWP